MTAPAKPLPESPVDQLVGNIGTAGWNIPRNFSDHFGSDGSALERYATTLGVTEINSSFHRSHRVSTWERWRDSTPKPFRFSVKLPKRITHELRLVDCVAELSEFIAEVGMLGSKLAVLLVQLPPSLVFEQSQARTFFSRMTSMTSTRIVCEPRHPSWFDGHADALLGELKVARVGADPAVWKGADVPGAHQGLGYWRLHGSPLKYRSSYSDRLGGYARLLLESAASRETWCIFDNTASSAAVNDALLLKREIISSNTRTN